MGKEGLVEAMAREQPDYVSYLLRLWRESGDGGVYRGDEKAVWRASVESSLSGERVGFANLEELFEFLRRQTSEQEVENSSLG